MCLSQVRYLYNLDKVSTNDTLYVASPAFQKVLGGFGDACMAQIFSHLNKLTGITANKRQTAIVMDMFDSVLVTSDLTKTASVNLLIKLWGMGKQGETVAVRQNRSRELIKSMQSLSGMAELQNMLV